MGKVTLEFILLGLVVISADVGAQVTTTIVEQRSCATNNDYIQLLQQQQQQQFTEEVATDVRSIKDNQLQQQQQLNNINDGMRVLGEQLRSSLSAESESMKRQLYRTATPLQQLNVQQQLPSSMIGSCLPILIQQRFDTADPQFFNRSWEEFKVGFNDTKGNYWLGNDMLHRVTKNGSFKLRIEMQTGNLWHWAEYSRFIVQDEAAGYLLFVGEFTGDVHDSLSYQNAMMFTTWDRDNDEYASENCGKGGFWYRGCCRCCINRSDMFTWFNSSNWLNPMHLKTSRMWLMCR